MFGTPHTSATDPGLRRSSATARSDAAKLPPSQRRPTRLPSAWSSACSSSGVTSTRRTERPIPAWSVATATLDRCPSCRLVRSAPAEAWPVRQSIRQDDFGCMLVTSTSLAGPVNRADGVALHFHVGAGRAVRFAPAKFKDFRRVDRRCCAAIWIAARLARARPFATPCR